MCGPNERGRNQFFRELIINIILLLYRMIRSRRVPGDPTATILYIRHMILYIIPRYYFYNILYYCRYIPVYAFPGTLPISLIRVYLPAHERVIMQYVRWGKTRRTLVDCILGEVGADCRCTFSSVAISSRSYTIILWRISRLIDRAAAFEDRRIDDCQLFS